MITLVLSLLRTGPSTTTPELAAELRHSLYPALRVPLPLFSSSPIPLTFTLTSTTNHPALRGILPATGRRLECIGNYPMSLQSGQRKCQAWPRSSGTSKDSFAYPSMNQSESNQRRQNTANSPRRPCGKPRKHLD